MSSQLNKSSISSLLLSSGEQTAIGRIRSASLGEEMSLIGFIAYTPSFINVDLNDHLIVTPYLIRFSKDKTLFPVCKTVKKAKGQKYKIDHHLLIDPMLDEIPKYILKNTIVSLPLTGDVLLNLMSKKWDKKDFFEQVEDGSYLYVARDEELELTGLTGKLTCIADDFLCLCTYMNKVTWMPSYALLPAYDVIRCFSENSTGEELLEADNMANPFGF